MENRCSLDGRVAVVVGAAGGIGQACVEALAAHGATVAAADIDRPAETGAAATTHAADVADAEAAARLIDDVAGVHGRLDVAVVAAGTIRVASVLDTTPAIWDHVFAVNARGSFMVAQAAAQRMREQADGGRIICFTSIVSRLVRPNNVAYCASKAALVQTVRCMAFELAPFGITVNAVSPGSTRTGMLLGGQMQDQARAEESVVNGDLASWRLGIPVGRMAEPDDQAAVAAFLATDEARHITGQEIVVDGGQSLV